MQYPAPEVGEMVRVSPGTYVEPETNVVVPRLTTIGLVVLAMKPPIVGADEEVLITRAHAVVGLGLVQK
jgi:hypothetical protein